MPIKKDTKKLKDNKKTKKRASTKRAVSVVKKSKPTKKQTKKSIKTKVIKKTSTSTKATTNKTKKIVSKSTVKKSNKKTSKTSSRNIKELISKTETNKLELNLFEPVVHFVSEFKEDKLDAPMLFLDDDTEEVTSEPEIIPSVEKVSEVFIRQSNILAKSQHILDLSETKIDRSQEDKKPINKSNQDLESFILGSDEDGIWQTMVMFMKGENEHVGSLYNFLNLSLVSWVVILGRVLFTIFNPISKALAAILIFFKKGLVDYVKMLGTVIKLAIHGQLNRNNLLNPEQALVDVALFDKPIVQPILQFQFNSIAIRSLVLFIILSTVVILPVKGIAFVDGLQKQKTQVLGVSENAYSSLQLAVEDLQQFSWLSASSHFQDSRSQFAAVYDQFQGSNTITRKILQTLPNTKNKIETADHLIQVGIDVSLLGEKVANLLNILQSDEEGVLLTGKIRAIQASLDDMHVIQSRITEHFIYIDIDTLPADIQGDVLLLKESLPKVFGSLSQVEELMNFAYILLGGDKQQRYILAFQNSDELRPTGGFMGSLTTATLYQGKIINMETPGGGPYDWQAWLTYPTIAPKPLWLVNPTWQFQDANWFVNFPTSAEKILDFYNQTKSERIDGVIAMNSYILPEIIRLIGDVELPAYDKVLTPDNVLYEIQSVVELEYDLEENKPKKIIGDLFEVITHRLLEDDSVQLIDILQIINKGLLERDIQMYFTHPNLQTKIHNWDWSGEVKHTNGDYLMLVNSNIGGAKTDKFMIQESILDSYVQPDGTIINELVIRRANNGIPGDVFYGHNNVDYLRVYVPIGSEIIDVVGDLEPPREELFEEPPSDIPSDSMLDSNIIFDSYDESGVRVSNQFSKTVFGMWLQTNLNETSEIKIRYRVPVEPIVISTQSDSTVVQKIDEFLRQSGIKSDTENKIWYSMYWQKQSGHHNHTIDYTLHFPNAWDIEHTARPGFVSGDSIKYQTLLEQDFSTGFLFGL